MWYTVTIVCHLQIYKMPLSEKHFPTTIACGRLFGVMFERDSLTIFRNDDFLKNIKKKINMEKSVRSFFFSLRLREEFLNSSVALSTHAGNSES